MVKKAIPTITCISVSIFFSVNLLAEINNCKTLAGTFSEDPNKLEDSDIAELRKCISDYMKTRLEHDSRFSDLQPIMKKTPSQIKQSTSKSASDTKLNKIE